MELTVNERRVVGVLIEKALAQPDYYPLTLNALTAGCNQRSNRDPVLSLTENEVREALNSLRGKGLSTIIIRDSGRTERWAHAADTAFSLEDGELAVLAELLLRGPQTEGELRGRASRMRKVETVAEIGEILRGQAQRDEPLVEQMPREPGKRGIRFRHLLAAAGEESARVSEEPAPVAAPAVEAAPDPGVRNDLEERLAMVEGQYDQLSEAVARLRGELDALKAELS